MASSLLFESELCSGLTACTCPLRSIDRSPAQGFVSFESFDEQHCVYRRTPALGCGVAAALLALTGVAVATAASECLGPDAPATGLRRAVAVKYCKNAWYVRA